MFGYLNSAQILCGPANYQLKNKKKKKERKNNFSDIFPCNFYCNLTGSHGQTVSSPDYVSDAVQFCVVACTLKTKGVCLWANLNDTCYQA
ncbi:Origin recognition complex subunit 2 [Labeo rohita]|uniref:Origin recognition complex subunit 2 n=1 Tax=Labeo rohita TaxID=84645 RepID=A0ABQ8LW58_LABRO|nr:Origin recognition complex subunit 2 [Labeo rohita]